MSPNLIGKGFVLETNVPENAKLNGQLLSIALEIALQFRQKNQRTTCSLQRKYLMCLQLYTNAINNPRQKYKRSELHGRVKASNLRNTKTEV